MQSGYLVKKHRQTLNHLKCWGEKSVLLREWFQHQRHGLHIFEALQLKKGNNMIEEVEMEIWELSRGR